mmetsp:Transcript_18644/g.47610  ORF Transcript_18644/g.47610 Transcript_18644/m.47610 type:complete len:162 (-) Transcript_18644:2550-3035(-)
MIAGEEAGASLVCTISGVRVFTARLGHARRHVHGEAGGSGGLGDDTSVYCLAMPTWFTVARVGAGGLIGAVGIPLNVLVDFALLKEGTHFVKLRTAGGRRDPDAAGSAGDKSGHLETTDAAWMTMDATCAVIHALLAKACTDLAADERHREQLLALKGFFA